MSSAKGKPTERTARIVVATDLISHVEVSPVSRLLEAERQAVEAQEALGAAKRAYAARDEALKAREAGLKARDKELQASILRLAPTLADNDAQRERAERRAVEEAAQREARTADAEALRRESEALRQEREEGQGRLAALLPYPQYLAAVVEVDRSLGEAEEVLARHAALQRTAAERAAKAGAAAAEEARLRRAAEMHTEIAAEELAALSSQAAALQRELADAQLQAAEAEAEHAERKAKAELAARERTQVLAAVGSLHERCLQRSALGRDPCPAAPSAQLAAVREFMGDLAAALQQYGAAVQPAGAEVES